MNTRPELIVRRRLHALGFRFRLHRKDLPGRPDVVLPKYRLAIMVHGCFWHQHEECKEGRKPTSNESYWGPKLARNVERDAEKESALKALGWRVLTVWECETKDLEKLDTLLAQAITID